MSEQPKIIVFCCNWSVYPGLQLSQLPSSATDNSVAEYVITMCSGRASPELVVEAFANGAWGVMVTGCPPGECDHEGNYNMRRRMTLLINTLEQLNINPQRIALDWFSPGEAAKLEKAVNKFTKEIAELGPINSVVEKG